MADTRLIGRLLVATPQLRDSPFDSAVILMLSHDDDDGSLGVIVNRPTGTPVGDLLPTWAEIASEPGVIFEGGPVDTDSALGLVRVGGPAEPLGVRRVSGQVGVVDLDTPTEVVGPAVRGMRVFAGYSGWAAGQLQDELDEGSWYVVGAESADPFRIDAHGLWRTVLRRQPGELALMASFPADPTLN